MLFFVRWPAKVTAGSECDSPICHVDLFATATAIAGEKLPAPGDAAPDSCSLLTLLTLLTDGSRGRQQPKGKSEASKLWD